MTTKLHYGSDCSIICDFEAQRKSQSL